MSNKLITLDQSLQTEKKWLENRDKLLSDAKPITMVNSKSDFEVSGAVQTRISKHIKKLSKLRLDVTRPIDAMKKKIMTQEKILAMNLNTEHKRLKAMNDAYALAEIKRQEAERQATIEAAAEIEMNEMSEQEKAVSIFGEGVIISSDPEPMPFIPVVEKPRTTSNRIRVGYDFQVVNPNMVLRAYLSVDEKKIKAYRDMQIKLNQIPDIPGVIFTKSASVGSR